MHAFNSWTAIIYMYAHSTFTGDYTSAFITFFYVMKLISF